MSFAIPAITLQGTKMFVRRLKQADERFSKGTERGLKKGGLFLIRESILQVPVEFGNLKASWIVRNIGGTGFKTRIVLGYTAEYAWYVHQRVAMSWKGLKRGDPFGNRAAAGIKEKPSRINPKTGQLQPHIGNYWDPAGRGKALFLYDPVNSEQNQARVTIIVRDETFVAKWQKLI